ncbi:MFS transporter [Actinomycetospora corticicola]|uniref:MFS family permease n=1 Tax=Actinomycetospora corticicola TaxID=663602 RepID=A0A7Y9J7M3_9PSEU|nr:MFS transporter [Actinomycetospora corticicola]NYD37554.1 MFS family permease [Actinomycetospora corticicola]
MSDSPPVTDGLDHTARPAGTDGDAAKARTAVRAGVLAYFVDQFDIYLPIVVLAPATAYFQSASLDAGTSAILTALVFASTLIARPVGAAIFGHFADTTSRKRTTLIAVAGFGVTTLLIACLPGYSTIGLWSVGLLIALRFVDGIFLGGEYTTAVPLAMEWSPKRRRGLNGGLITCTSPGAYAVIATVTLLLLEVIPSAGPDSAYSQWGWRIPFVVGALLAVVLYRQYSREVEEPPTERTAEGARSPLAELVTGPHRRALAQVFVLMSGVWLANNMTSAVMPGLLKSDLGFSSTQVSIAMAVTMAITAASFPLFGVLSQRIGRRRFYLGFAVAMIVIGGGAYAALVTTRPTFGLALVLTTLIGIFTLGTFGPIAAYLTERFPSTIRASGYGVGYSLALIIPAFYAFYLSGLSAVLPGALGAVALLVVAGVLVGVGGLLGPETRDVDMRDAEHRTATPAAEVLR